MATDIEAEIKEFDEVLKSADLLVDESVQIYELESEKNNVIDELYNSLKTITEFLGFSVDLPSSIFHESEDTRITLTPTLDVVIRKNNGKIFQKRLDEFSTKKIATILKSAILPIIELCKNEKIIQNKNITFLKAVTNKLNNVQEINVSKNNDSDSNSGSQNNSSLNQSTIKQSDTNPSKMSEAL